MIDLSSNPPTNESSLIQHKRTRNSRDAMMMTTLTKIHNVGVKMQKKNDLKSGRCYCKHVATFRSSMTLHGRSKASILIEDWGQVEPEVKESIWANVVVLILLYMIFFISIYNHIYFCFKLISTLYCKCRMFLLFEIMISWKRN